MDDLQSWSIVIAGAMLLNAIPLFIPPTWLLLAWFHLQEGLGLVPVALVGSASATVGRALLATASRRLSTRVVPPRWRSNLDGLADVIRHNRAMSSTTIGLLLVGAAPTNNLFIAAGIARAPLAPLLIPFCIGRFTGYLLWVGVARTVTTSLEEAFTSQFGSGAIMAGQLLGVLGLILVMQVNWRRRFASWPGGVPEKTGKTSSLVSATCNVFDTR